jgi:hypothetical protein
MSSVLGTELASTFAGIAWDPHIRGALSVIVAVGVLCGSVYLILGTNLGARLGLLVALAGLAGWMVILTLIWWIAPPGIGPKGESPAWEPVEVYVHGPDTPLTEVASKLPPPDQFPTPDEILASNPDLATDFPNGFVLSDLEGTHPELVEQYLQDLELNGWSLVSTSSAGEAQAAADVALANSNLFAAPTDYKKLDTFDYGGKPSRLDDCPDAEGGSLVPTDPVCRVTHWIKNTLTFRHPTHYQIVQVQQVIPQEARAGEPPPLPQVDPDAPVISVVLVRDLGYVRLIPFLYFIISLSLFTFFVLVLHYRDKTLTRNLEAAEAVGEGA